MSHRLSQNARHTKELLEELERDKELEVLREYLTRFGLFPRGKDPAAAPIRFEELKELVKHWKLHRQRNFWKTHTTKEDLVRTLYAYINAQVAPQESQLEAPVSSSAVNETAVPFGSTGANSGPNAGAVAPCAPVRRPSQRGSFSDAPHTKSFLADRRHSRRVTSSSPSKTGGLRAYQGDLFGQRGEYEDGMIYLSRLRKPNRMTGEERAIEESDSNQRVATAEASEGEASAMDATVAQQIACREVRSKQECAFSIYYYTTEAGNEKAMVTEGSVLALCRLSNADSVEVKRLCAAAILNLTWDLALSTRMIEEGVLVALVELAKPQHEEIRRHTSAALCRLSYDVKGQQRLVQEGCVSAILSMLNAPENETKEACVKTLINISSHTSASITESVIQVIQKSANRTDAAGALFASEAMRNLSLLGGARGRVVEDGILDNLQVLTQSTADPLVQENLAAAVSNFTTMPSNLASLSHSHILASLAVLLQSEQQSVQEMCAVAMANISSHAGSLTHFVVGDAMTRLIELGHHAGAAAQESMALTFSNIAATPDSAHLLGRLGVVTLLLQFLSGTGILAQQHTLTALVSLTANASTSSELMQSNVVAALASLAATYVDKARDLCANALYNLSCDKLMHSLLLKDDAIKAMVQLCRRAPSTAEDPATSAKDKTPIGLQLSQEWAIASLYNLSFGEESRKILVRTDVVKTLCAVFPRRPSKEEVARQCAGVIANLSFEADCQSRIVEDGCVRLIQTLMGTGSKDVFRFCSIACCNLVPEALEKTAVLAMLIELAATSHPAVMLNCAIAFCKLASNAACRPVLIKCAELYPALTLMMRCGIEDIQIYSAATLCNLAVERPERSKHIWREGTLPDFIVNSLLRINSDSTKEICARALFNLLTHDEHRASQIQQGVLYALVKLARLESEEIRSLCVIALYNLSSDASMINTLLETNVAQVITKICDMEFSNQDTHRRLAACLANLSVRTDAQLQLVEGSALAAVLVLSEHNDPPTLRSCAFVLCCLSTQRVNCDAMAANNVIDVLVKIVASDDDNQNLLGLHALCNISSSASLHDRIEEAGAIGPVLRLLGISTTSDITLICAKILANLTFHAKFRRLLMQKGLVSVMLAVFDRQPIAPSVIGVCVEILAVMSDDNDAWHDLARLGAVKILRAMAPCCQGDGIIRCLYTLNQIARADDPGCTVIRDGALDIVASASAGGSASPPQVTREIRERCSSILRSLSVRADCRADLVKDSRTVSIMKSITADGDGATCKNCTLAMYNLACSDCPALGTLTAAGVVRLLIHLATRSGTELAPLCAISLAHIKRIEGESATASPPSPAAPETNEMERGLVSTLLPMTDLDHGSLPRFDHISLVLPSNPPPARPAEWRFWTGEMLLRLLPQLPVVWAFQSSDIDDTRFAPTDPKAFATLLETSTPPSGPTMQERLFGMFRVMQVHHDKVRVVDIPPPRESVDGQGVANMTDAIEAALESPRATDAMNIATTASAAYGSDTEEQDESRAAVAPTKRTATLKNLMRAASIRNAADSVLHRSSRNNSRASFHHEGRLSTSAKRKHTVALMPVSPATEESGNGGGIILPRL